MTEEIETISGVRGVGRKIMADFEWNREVTVTTAGPHVAIRGTGLVDGPWLLSAVQARFLASALNKQAKKAARAAEAQAKSDK